MRLDLRNHLVSVVAGLAISFAPGMAHAINADVLTISVGAGYAGGPVELTIPEANQSPALTLLFLSPRWISDGCQRIGASRRYPHQPTHQVVVALDLVGVEPLKPLTGRGKLRRPRPS